MHKHNNTCKLCGSNNTHGFVWGRMIKGEHVENVYIECNDCGCLVPESAGKINREDALDLKNSKLGE